MILLNDDNYFQLLFVRIFHADVFHHVSLVIWHMLYTETFIKLVTYMVFQSQYVFLYHTMRELYKVGKTNVPQAKALSLVMKGSQRAQLVREFNVGESFITNLLFYKESIKKCSVKQYFHLF